MSLATDEPKAPDKPAEPKPIPGYIRRRLDRSRQASKKNASNRRLYYKFWRGDTYWQVNQKGMLVQQGTISVSAGGDKPGHRIRNKYPFIGMVVQAKVSGATQKVPSYEVVPSKTDIEAGQAAKLSEKALLDGWDKWHMQRAVVKQVEHALVGGEGFAYPVFDNTVGPYVDDGQGGVVGQGEIKIKVLSGNEVSWEPGVDFDDSPYWLIEQAVPVDVIKEMPGFLGGEIKPDATDADLPTEADKGNLAILSEYLERPSLKKKRGLRLVLCNGRPILPDEDYPCENKDGDILDEPVLVRLSYTVETDDHDRGLVEMLVDLQRTIQDCWNKLLEWKNRCLNPQMITPRGSNMARRDDTPGANWIYTPVGGQKPEWERPPPIPRELFDILDKAVEHMRALAADVDVQPDPRLTAQTAQAAIDQAALRWQSFLADLALVHSRVGRLCLYLVQKNYTEPRLLKIQGTFGPDLTPGFLGSNLLDQTDVRVNPDTLASRSRSQVISETLLFADRQWISPQAAMATIRGGVAEKLGQSWELDVGRANFLIQTIKRGSHALMSLGEREPYPGEQTMPDPQTGLPMPVPAYMPRPFDNAEIQIEVFESWMKTTDWDHLAPDLQHQAILVYQAYKQIQQQQAMQKAALEQMAAQNNGLQNAARPQDNQGMPSQRQPGSEPSPYNGAQNG